MSNEKSDISIEERGNKAAIHHRRYLRAWKSAGYPKHFRYTIDAKTGEGKRIWDVAARKEALEMAEMKSATRELMISTRKAEYENRLKRQDIKKGII